jgi:hypothetical protein
MNRWLFLTTAGLALAAGAWWLGYFPSCCGGMQEIHRVEPIQAAPPATPQDSPKIHELLNNSEGIGGQIQFDPKHTPFIDHPSHLTPERIDGAIQ